MQDTNLNLTAVFQKVPEGYIAFVEELPGANTQGATLEEARENLKEAVALVLEANRFLEEKSLEKIGFYNRYRFFKSSSNVKSHTAVSSSNSLEALESSLSLV
jgi:predicted RNase H-like HicB family nuclease